MAQFDLRKLFGIPTPGERLAGLNLRPDLAAAASRMVSDERSDPELQALQRVLLGSESVLAVLEGRCLRQLGLLALTTVRLIFRPHGAAPGKATVLPLTDVSFVDSQFNRMTGSLVLRSTDSIVEVDKILGQQAAAFAEAVRGRLNPTGSQPVRDPLQELLDLRRRRAAGTISHADYDMAKSRLLDEL